MRQDVGVDSLKSRNHLAHRNKNHRDGQYRSKDHFPAKVIALLVLLFRLRAGIRFPRFITGVPDGLMDARQRQGVRQERHKGFLGGQIDTGLDHTGLLVQCFLNPRHTGAAGHAGNGNFRRLYPWLITRILN